MDSTEQKFVVARAHKETCVCARTQMSSFCATQIPLAKSRRYNSICGPKTRALCRLQNAHTHTDVVCATHKCKARARVTSVQTAAAATTSHSAGSHRQRYAWPKGEQSKAKHWGRSQHTRTTKQRSNAQIDSFRRRRAKASGAHALIQCSPRFDSIRERVRARPNKLSD